MNDNFFLEKKELTCTFINLIVVKMLFTYPRVMIQNSGNAAWIQMIYVTLIALGIFLFIDHFFQILCCVCLHPAGTPPRPAREHRQSKACAG